MLPEDIAPSWIELPETTDHSIVIVTGNKLRHKRFALRLIKEFGALVVGWYEVDPTLDVSTSRSVNPVLAGKSVDNPGIIARVIRYYRQKGAVGTLRRLKNIVSERWHHLTTSGSINILMSLLSLIANRQYKKAHNSTLAEAERKLFEDEVAQLSASTHLEPKKISPSFVHSEEFLVEIEEIDPYFFLTLGGPLYKKTLLSSIRGVSINQHAGHSPEFKGSGTTAWALYHRSLKHVSSTVHITITGADAGPILRRSSPCIHPDDDYFTIFSRVVALGTELMVEVVQQILQDKRLISFEQGIGRGQTYLSKDLDHDIHHMINSDLTKGWLPKTLIKQRTF